VRGVFLAWQNASRKSVFEKPAVFRCPNFAPERFRISYIRPGNDPFLTIESFRMFAFENDDCSVRLTVIRGRQHNVVQAPPLISLGIQEIRVNLVIWP
jgi:hypothetical protein